MYTLDIVAPRLPTTKSSAAENGEWTNSRVYTSFELQERGKFRRISRLRMKKDSITRNSPFIPSTFEEFISHRLGILEESIKTLQEILAIRRKKPIAPETTPLSKYKSWSAMLDRIGEGTFGFTADDPSSEELGEANRAMDRCSLFRAHGEFWLGEDLLNKL